MNAVVFQKGVCVNISDVTVWDFRFGSGSVFLALNISGSGFTDSGSGFTEPDPEFRIGIYRTVKTGSGFYRTGKFGIGIYRTGKFGIGIYRIGPLAIFGPGETSRERLL